MDGIARGSPALQAGHVARFAILTLGVALVGACTPATRALPAAADAARAWNDKRSEPCARLIDLCENVYFVAPPPEAVGDLRCSGNAKTATCTFRIEQQRCRARFERVANSGWAPMFARPLRGFVVKCRDVARS